MAASLSTTALASDEPTGAAATRQRRTPIDGEHLTDGVGLCLSGGGYRAMLFHVGAVYRMNELGLLPKIKRISSVSGGALTAAALAAGWSELTFDGQGRATNLDEVFWAPQRALASESIDIVAALGGFLPFNSAARETVTSYEQHLTRRLMLADLPTRPQFVFNATNLMTGSNFSFYRDHLYDWRVGRIRSRKFSLAEAVAASASFPPFLSPLDIDFSGAKVETSAISYLTGVVQHRATLADGGVYDNLGTEPVWKRFRTVLVSNGGHPFAEDAYPGNDWISQVIRVVGILMNDAESLRKRILHHAYEIGARRGAMWSLNSGAHDLRERPPHEWLSEDDYRHVQTISTRLTRFSDRDQNLLIKAGYAHAAHKLRFHYGPSQGGVADAPVAMSYPQI